jgi:Polysaccharide lyase/CARDB
VLLLALAVLGPATARGLSLGSKPDLVVRSLSVPAVTDTRAGALKLTDVVRNVGSRNAGSSVIRYYLSRDRARGGRDIRVSGSRRVKPLEPGRSSRGSVRVTWRGGVRNGHYFLLACADAAGRVREGHEANNCHAARLRLLTAGAAAARQRVIWSADMETGNLSQWTRNGTRGGSFDSGDCLRPSNGVSTEVAHSGRYSMKMTINLAQGESGCRQFRHQESRSGETLYYGAWYYLPSYVRAENYWNIFQFKSETSSQNDPFWALDLMPRRSGQLQLRLRWKGTVVGPTERDTSTGTKTFDQRAANVPVGRWFHVEVFLKQASEFNGRLTVWQDGKRLYDMNGVKTKYPGGDERWSVNNYSDGLRPSVATLFVDDATVSRPLP